MSWLDKIKSPFVVHTGNGHSYKPKAVVSSFSLVTEYQTAEFNFIGVAGSLVKKEQPIGVKYNFEIYFDGENHEETAEKFRVDCNDKRPWTIEHPLYGLINVQPTQLNWDNSNGNVTKITGTVIETILESPALVDIHANDQVPVLFELATEDLTLALKETPTPADINTLTEDNALAYSKGVPIINTDEQFQQYTNAFNTAQTYINTATATPLLMMRAVIAVLTLPAQVTAAVQDRMGVLIDTFNSLRENIEGLLGISSKQLYQNKNGALIAGMCIAATTPQTGDYKNSSTVLETMSQLIAARTAYIEDLDTLQNENASTPDSFVADAEALISLNELVNVTVSALFNLSLSARSERSIILEKDTNWIELAHRLYGLDPADKNINDLIDENQTPGIQANFLNEYIQIKKDRRIVYYV